MSSRFTVIQADGAAEVEATLDDQTSTVLLGADAVRCCFGWERKPEGLCQGDVCIPARRLAGIEDDDGRFDLAGLAALLDRPVALDLTARAAFVGVAASIRSAQLTSFTAPDFTLTDLDGRPHSLSEHRGKKVFLATWASW
jgi:hypothetical protein